MIPLAEVEKGPEREGAIVRRCLVRLNRLPNVRAARNNTGKSPIACKVCKMHLCKRCKPRLTYPIAFGLGEGGPDIVGFFAIGGARLPLPVWFGIEVKTPHARAAHPEIRRLQEIWRKAAARLGVLTAEVVSELEAVERVEAFRDEYTRRLVIL